MEDTVSVAHPVVKVASVWGVLYITTWADVAAALAALYSLLLIAEWVWRKFLRSLCERIGLLPPAGRTKRTRTDDH